MPSYAHAGHTSLPGTIWARLALGHSSVLGPKDIALCVCIFPDQHCSFLPVYWLVGPDFEELALNTPVRGLGERLAIFCFFTVGFGRYVLWCSLLLVIGGLLKG